MANIVALGFVTEIEKRLRDEGYFYSPHYKAFLEVGSNNMVRINTTTFACHEVWAFVGADQNQVDAVWSRMVARPRVLKDFR